MFKSNAPLIFIDNESICYNCDLFSSCNESQLIALSKDIDCVPNYDMI